MDAQAYLSIHLVHRSFSWICHAAAHSSFTMERKVQESMSAIYFILQNTIFFFSGDFCHILSYKRALCVTIALKW